MHHAIRSLLLLIAGLVGFAMAQAQAGSWTIPKTFSFSQTGTFGWNDDTNPFVLELSVNTVPPEAPIEPISLPRKGPSPRLVGDMLIQVAAINSGECKML